MALVSPQLSEKVRGIVATATGLPAEEIAGDVSLQGQLGVDSLSVVDIAVRCEDAFGVRIDDEVMQQVRSVDDLTEFVASHATKGLPEA